MTGERKKRIPPHTLRVVVTLAERDQIAAAAERLGLSTSAYLRSLGLGYQPIGHLDKDGLDHLVKTRNDLARMGNLLKLWLSDDTKLKVFKPGEAVAYIGRLLPAIHANQVQLYEILQGVIRQGSPLRTRLLGKPGAPE